MVLPQSDSPVKQDQLLGDPVRPQPAHGLGLDVGQHGELQAAAPLFGDRRDGGRSCQENRAFLMHSAALPTRRFRENERLSVPAAALFFVMRPSGWI
jgi:hypothetical protein